MPALTESFPEIFSALALHYGRREALTGRDAPFMALAAAILAGGPEPRLVSAASSALNDAGLLEPRALAEADVEVVREALKEGGIALKPRAVAPLLRLARWRVERALVEEGSVSTTQLREELLSLNGVGPATADSLLLFALGRAVYPLDRATYRVLVRHGWLEPSADYDEARDVIEQRLPDDPDGMARLSDWLERIGRDFCRVRAPKCERCPLRPFLPERGPVEGDESGE